MDNPFNDLPEKRRAVQEQDKRRREQEQLAKRNAKRLLAAETYGATVSQLLDQLWQAMYGAGFRISPKDIKDVGPTYSQLINPRWEITEELDGTFYARVSVALLFDDTDNPTGFECTRRGVGFQLKTLSRKAGLSRENLIAALKYLYQ